MRVNYTGHARIWREMDLEERQDALVEHLDSFQDPEIAGGI